MSLKLNRYLKALRSNANYFEKLDVNGKISTNLFSKNQRRIIGFLISILSIFFLEKGFNESAISLISTILSIIIGLFISVLIVSFDKFYQKNMGLNSIWRIYEDSENPGEYLAESFNAFSKNSQDKVWETQTYNFAKQFAYITGYSIVLAIFSIVFLLMTLVKKDFFTINIFEELFFFLDSDIFDYWKVSHIVSVIFYRVLVNYLLFSVFYFSLFIIGSLVHFMIQKLDNNN